MYDCIILSKLSFRPKVNGFKERLYRKGRDTTQHRVCHRYLIYVPDEERHSAVTYRTRVRIIPQGLHSSTGCKCPLVYIHIRYAKWSDSQQ